jgi:2-iminobutanoate/2-iminopropanoate deaminase
MHRLSAMMTATRLRLRGRFLFRRRGVIGRAVPGGAMADTAHRPVTAEGLPKPVGPYSPGIVFDRLVFVSGQGATDPGTGKLAGPDVATQTEQVFRNIEAILRAAGTDLQHVLRCGVFLVDMTEFEAMNRVYGRVFGEHRPARTTVEVSALPAIGLRVEIDCIACVP